jgi:hypothetical protein
VVSRVLYFGLDVIYVGEDLTVSDDDQLGENGVFVID